MTLDRTSKRSGRGWVAAAGRILHLLYRRLATCCRQGPADTLLYSDCIRHAVAPTCEWALAAGLLLGGGGTLAGAEPTPAVALVPVLTNLLQLRRVVGGEQCVSYPVRLDGVVLWASQTQGDLFLQDDSGAMAVQLDLRGQPPVLAGQRVHLEGRCVAGQGVIREALVDNDGLHGPQEKSGAIYLATGRHPLRAEWFNGPAGWELEIEYEGPELPRQRIPESALFRAVTEPDEGTSNLLHGLDYRCYEGDWKRLPDFHRLQPVKTGTVADFDLRVRTRDQKVGLQFGGYLEVPRDGLYTFWTRSDDGSRLFVGDSPLRVSMLGTASPPVSRPIAPGQVLRPDQEDQWSEAEGTVAFASEQGGALQLELSSSTGRLRVEIAHPAGSSALLLLNSRIRVTGVCQGTYASDGQRVAGRLLVPGSQQIELLEVVSARWDEYPVTPIGQLGATNVPKNMEAIAHIRGKVRSVPPERGLVVEDESGQLLVETTQRAPRTSGGQVEVLGRWSRAGTNVVLESGLYRELAGEESEATNALPVLLTVDQIKRLDRQEAQRGYPLRIRGVIIGVWPYGAFALQDSTRAVYVEWRPALKGPAPRVGDFWEVEGETFAGFAPNVRPRRAVRLGAGTLPEPLHPTWDQLSNGSLDTQYVEVQGIITAIQTDGVAFLTRSGKIKVQFPGLDPHTLGRYQNALVRVRGCLSPRYNARQQAQVGQIRLFSASFNVDEPAPADPFAAPLKRACDLLLYDPQAGAMQRVRLAGQVLHELDGEFYLMDNGCGVRFVPQTGADLGVGDLVQVVGFTDLGGPSPVLREAVARRTGQAALPTAQSLSETNFLNGRYDATLVRVPARLVNMSVNRSEQALELQAGTREFVARLRTRHGLARGLVAGSRLELTGVYAGRGGNRALGRDIDSFELLLNSPADIRVLERPSWWRLGHTLAVLGSMGSVMLAALVWITLLRRQVEERTRQLAARIRDHEQTERQRALEADRARIARDLHDDLGASLTGIGLLAQAGAGALPTLEKAGQRFRAIRDKARETVSALDLIVWLVNPRKDALPALATYLASYTEEYLSASGIACHLKIPMDLPPLHLAAEVRQGLLLAVKETLNNVVCHSQASQVETRLTMENGWLEIVVADDGRGFDASAPASGDGLVNLRERLARLS
jgi:signal transduction histidine kinase